MASKVQQFADFFLPARNLRIEVIDLFLNSRLKSPVVAYDRIGLDNLQHVALVGIDWLIHDSVMRCYRLRIRHAQRRSDH